MGLKFRHIFTLLSLVILDQALKYAVQQLSASHIPIIPNLFSIDLVFNKGAAYGILHGKRGLLIGVSVFVLVISLWGHRHLAKTAWSKWGLSILLAGTLGNLIDRVFMGHVVDYINIYIFPVFNLADICIDIGVGLFLVEMVMERKRPLNTSNRRLP